MEENKLIALLRKHGSKIFLVILALATIGVCSERYFQKGRSEKKEDFLIAQHIFERFQKGETLSSESIESMQNILDRHPELHPKYDSVLAITFLSQQKSKEASFYAHALVKHTQKQLPTLYKDYTQTTLLISERNYNQAFNAALSLEKELTNTADSPVLDAMNTLRLLFLARKIGDVENEKVYWSKLNNHPFYPTIAPLFQIGNMNLSEFLLLSS